MTWPFPQHEAEGVGAEEPIPRWKFWRRPPHTPDPEPCSRCGQDQRGKAHLLVDRRPWCFPCAMGADEALR